MKVFITGATGFIGSYVVKELQEHGHEVLGLARSDSSTEKLAQQGVKPVRGSLEDLDVLHQAAREADGVIHLGYVHDFGDKEQKFLKIDENAIRAMCTALEDSNKPFIGTSGLLGLPVPSTEHDKAQNGLRQPAEDLVHSFASRGVRSVVVRASPIVHGRGDHMFLPFLISNARAKGYAGYMNEGTNEWTGVHVQDLAVLYRLALEKEEVKGGSTLHAVDKGDERISMRQLAETIGSKLKVEVRKLDEGEEARGYFEWMYWFMRWDSKPSTRITRELTGWESLERTLKEDLESGVYF
ncbi:hypothetical protein I302_107362 [Kwoniella bestiolae CBS 10118]|uniref:NAD-dependent epimerase/dehydratase domain-containing protein n=1 Tax=Kwoniella bestiolae CBS 10118 TaxID=1296100 RepID=A0A1B9FYS8_9TREE|nr:hypothetical protein I302_06900 [Kwoniella bestiolae CBS 10118]OCF23914.1 hypothetical protein I302_06900 [Kwoniella bestiolae CBS 10118]